MEEIANLVSTYGIPIVICIIFLWDYVVNKKQMTTAMQNLEKTNTIIASCLEEMKENNKNMEASLKLLQKSMDTQTQKIDKLLERK